MAMDDIYKLVEAVVVHAQIANPSRDGLVLDFKKKHPVADVISATVHMNHEKSHWEGSVRFQIRGETGCHVESLWRLWLDGWVLPLEHWETHIYNDGWKEGRADLRAKTKKKGRVKK